MGVLKAQVDIEMKGIDVVKYYKDNVQLLYNLYSNPDGSKGVEEINISDMHTGGFFFMHYMDESNWMQYSPIMFIDTKEFENRIIGYAINFNFIPFEYRIALFDKYLNDLVDNYQLSSITFENAYKMLLEIGYEYAIVEYDMKRVERVFSIDLSILSKFLYSSYPTNKYDPNKLYSIWLKKLETREKRHQELIASTVEEFFDMEQNISDSFEALENHVKRLQRNMRKFG